MKKLPYNHFGYSAPPSSYPSVWRRKARALMHISAQPVNTATEKTRLPERTTKPPFGYSACMSGYAAIHSSVAPFCAQYSAPSIQGRPRPSSTFTALEPVTFTIDASAVSSITAADFDAKVSGSDVPIATRVIAVMESGRPRQQPKMDATSPMIAVTKPMKRSDTAKLSLPSQMRTGGTKVNASLNGKVMKWTAQSAAVGGGWASSPPLTCRATRKLSHQEEAATSKASRLSGGMWHIFAIIATEDAVSSSEMMVTSQVALCIGVVCQPNPN
mmetsp:Transcript_27111/g.67163  ORF Transcript_27111/g.67163 Transcript_27111/m.67163 type:complete len:272 (+) Transcript_27111:488-1303(+)